MANYNVDIAVALKGAEKLSKFNKQIRDVSNNIKSANTFLESFSKTARLASGAFDGANGLVRNVDNLQKNLGLAKTNLRSVALGTKEATIAAHQFVKAREQLNKGLQEELALINKVEEARRLTRLYKAGIRPGTMYSGPIGPGQATSMFGGRVRQNIAASQAIRGMSGFAAFSGGATQVSQNAKTEAIQAKARAKHLKNIDKKVAKIATIQTQQQTQRGFGGLSQGFGVSGGQIGPRLPRGFRFRQQFKQGGMFGMPGGAMGRLKGGAGSAMIGGGFPLLFGAGGLSAAMGGVGGAIGGALAPGGGFAASIAATALAAQIEKVREFRKSVSNLNKEMAIMGISFKFSRKEIKELAKDFDITNQEAIELLSNFKTFGEDAGLLAEAFGDEKVFNTLKGLRDTDAVLGKIESLRDRISETTRQDLLQTLAKEGSLKAQIKLEEEMFKQRREEFIKENIATKIYDIPQEFRSRDKQKEFFDAKRIRLGKEFDEKNQKGLLILEQQIKINEQMQFIAEFQAPTDQLREMFNPMRQILDLSNAIRDGFEGAFKGLIRGTMSVSDAFRNMFYRIADHFIDMAARMAAVQLQQGFLSLFSSMFSTPMIGDLGVQTGDRMAGSRYKYGKRVYGGQRADGGPVGSGKSYIVGEKGPEIFTPGVSGGITPNHALGGSTSISVNIDASGTSVEGSEPNGEELGRLVAAAIQSELIKEKRPGGLLS